MVTICVTMTLGLATQLMTYKNEAGDTLFTSINNSIEPAITTKVGEVVRAELSNKDIADHILAV